MKESKIKSLAQYMYTEHQDEYKKGKKKEIYLFLLLFIMEVLFLLPTIYVIIKSDNAHFGLLIFCLIYTLKEMLIFIKRKKYTKNYHVEDNILVMDLFVSTFILICIMFDTIRAIDSSMVLIIMLLLAVCIIYSKSYIYNFCDDLYFSISRYEPIENANINNKDLLLLYFYFKNFPTETNLKTLCLLFEKYELSYKIEKKQNRTGFNDRAIYYQLAVDFGDNVYNFSAKSINGNDVPTVDDCLLANIREYGDWGVEQMNNCSLHKVIQRIKNVEFQKQQDIEMEYLNKKGEIEL